MSNKYVYVFANGEADGNGAMKDLLGGKGAGLAEMTNALLPVPPGFTITTEACNAYYGGGERFPEGSVRARRSRTRFASPRGGAPRRASGFRGRASRVPSRARFPVPGSVADRAG